MWWSRRGSNQGASNRGASSNQQDGSNRNYSIRGGFWGFMLVVLSCIVAVDVMYMHQKGFKEVLELRGTGFSPLPKEKWKVDVIKQPIQKSKAKKRKEKTLEAKDKLVEIPENAQERPVEKVPEKVEDKPVEEEPKQIEPHKVAGLTCKAYGGPSDELAAEMVYWQDIPVDASFASPYKSKESQYLTFEPDEGGWNNIRMSMETAVTMALAMGRTLVMPPEQGMYLLEKNDKRQKNKFSFTDFFHFESVAEEHQGVDIISFEEFLEREVMTGHVVDKATGKPNFPPGNRTNWNGVDRMARRKTLDEWTRTLGFSSPWNFDRCMAGFTSRPNDAEGEAFLNEIAKEVTSIKRERRFKMFTNKPVAVDSPPKDRLMESMANRDGLCIYDHNLQKEKVFHLMGDNASKARLLIHFYAFLFFENWRQDVWTKRFVRDHLRYIDEIQCAAARVVHAMREVSKKNGNGGVFDTFHIRRGDFQYKDTRVEIDVIFNNTFDVLEENTTVYIATDERDKPFFDLLRKRYKIYFMDDFKDLLTDVNTNYFGMVDQLVASRGRTFIGTFYSTFTGYINRVRGYHSQKDKAEGHDLGVINSYFDIPLNRKYEMREYRPLRPAFWAREFPIGWRDLDKGIGEVSVIDDRPAEKVEDKLAEKELAKSAAEESKQVEQHKVAGLSCKAYGGPGDEHAAEMVYWQDIPLDASFVSPFKSKEEQYLTFEPDEGGWNNIRMSMETAVTMALAMGRTLVMPPEQGMYLLWEGEKKQKNKFTFTDFFHFKSVADEHKAVDIIGFEEFLNREIMSGHIVDQTGNPLFPPNNRTNWNGAEREEAKKLDAWTRMIGFSSPWNYEKCMAAFTAKPNDVEGEKRLNEIARNVTSVDMNERYNKFVNKPAAVDAPPLDRLMESMAHRKDLCIYDHELQKTKVFHLMGDGDARMLVHFYAFLFFENWKQDVWTKRFVRDHLRYIDEIQCAAARVVHAMREVSNKNGNDGVFDTFHIRRGDFQYEDTRVGIDVIFNNTFDLLEENSTIYIATDERDKAFFDVLRKRYKIYFMDDFKDFLTDVNTNYFGMIDQLVASRGRTFIGTFFSTFTGYITRVRGYHGQQDKAEGYELGVANTYYYIPKDRKHAMRKYRPVHEPLWAREFPIGWRDLDKGIGELKATN